MAKIYKSETICELCEKPIPWYAIINKHIGDTITFSESDVYPYREVKILSSKDKTARLRIRCKECDTVNTFFHTLTDD